MKGVLRLVAAVSFGVMVASAQIFGLSTDSTGRDIYFSTYLSQRGLGQPKYSGGNIEPFKFFRLRDGALTLIEQAPSQDLSLLVLGRYSYPRASVSANGDVLAVNRLAICLSGLAYTCEAASTLIQTPRGNLSFTGNATLSANGRFAALFGNTDQSIPLLSSVRRVDLESGRATMVGYQAAQAGRVIADDGTILFWGEGGVRLSGPTQDITLAPKFRMQRAELAGDASRIVYEADYIGEIRVLDVSSGSDVSLGNGYFPTLAQDGRTFSCLRFGEDKAQVWLGDALTGAVRALTNEPDGILEQTISGDGRKVVAATYQGRVLSINTITGEVTQLLGPV